jgi:alcohol dehydrogenase class IV
MSALDSTKHESSSLQGFYGWTDTLKGVYYGPGSLKTALPKLLDTLGTKKALIVTGKSLHNKVSYLSSRSSSITVPTRHSQTDIVRRVENVLKERNSYGATFYEIGEHAPISGIKKGIEVFRDSGADVIVSVGGGSPIDASKAMIHTIQKESGGAFYRQIAIPTTLSAAEYTVCFPVINMPLESDKHALRPVQVTRTNKE